MELAGRNVGVTGAGRGIGGALGRAFHDRGARVMLADLDGAEAVADSMAGAHGVTADDSTEAGNRALVDMARDAFGTIDLFFANAGVGIGAGVLELSLIHISEPTRPSP